MNPTTPPSIEALSFFDHALLACLGVAATAMLEPEAQVARAVQTAELLVQARRERNKRFAKKAVPTNPEAMANTAESRVATLLERAKEQWPHMQVDRMREILERASLTVQVYLLSTDAATFRGTLAELCSEDLAVRAKASRVVDRAQAMDLLPDTERLLAALLRTGDSMLDHLILVSDAAFSESIVVRFPEAFPEHVVGAYL